MDNNLFNLLNMLDFEEGEVLFQQREQGASRISFEMEKQLFSFVAQGKPDEMVKHYLNFISASPDLQISVGKLSSNHLRQLKYMAVSLVAVICRIAMYAGAPEAVAYSMSDDIIQQIDKLEDPDDILLLELSATYDYAELVAQSKHNLSYSKPVRDSIEYIVANLHSPIALSDLAAQGPYSKEYLAKLFRKEVGKTVSDYILELRVDEAKRMLDDGKTSREVAYLLHFCSQSYFIKQFKKIAGMTPKEYSLSR